MSNPHERMDQPCSLRLGTRDSVHVPFTVAAWKGSQEEKFALEYRLTPGSFVRFVNDSYTEFALCAREDAHGIINPFLEEICVWDPVSILLLPGITSEVRHTFEIDPQRRDQERQLLEDELEKRKEEDPACADCWHIRNNTLIRD